MNYSFSKVPPLLLGGGGGKESESRGRGLKGTAGRIHMRRGVHGAANHAPVSWSMDFNSTCAGPSGKELLRRAASVYAFILLFTVVSISYHFMEQNVVIPFAKLKRQKLANSVTFRPEYYTVKVYRKYRENSWCCGH